MTERDRLSELLAWSPMIDTIYGTFADAADCLLEKGVIVPPCKVGDKVYIVAEVTKKIIECTVIGAWICEGSCSIITDHGTIYNLSLDTTVFLTKEEAEKALKEGVGE